MPNRNVSKVIAHSIKTILSKDEIEGMTAEDIGSMLYHYQILYVELKVKYDWLSQELQDATREKEQHREELRQLRHDLLNILNAISLQEELIRGGMTAAGKINLLDMMAEVNKSIRGVVERAFSRESEGNNIITFENLPAAQSVTSLEDKKARNYKILLVEDDPSNILIISAFLENLGYGYDVVSNGQEALRKAREYPYALILMDVSIPGLNGLNTTRQLRDLEKKGLKPFQPVIAMTAHALDKDREQCLKAGMNDYIAKPFSQVQLQQKIEENI